MQPPQNGEPVRGPMLEPDGEIQDDDSDEDFGPRRLGQPVEQANTMAFRVAGGTDRDQRRGQLRH